MPRGRSYSSSSISSRRTSDSDLDSLSNADDTRPQVRTNRINSSPSRRSYRRRRCSNSPSQSRSRNTRSRERDSRPRSGSLFTKRRSRHVQSISRSNKAPDRDRRASRAVGRSRDMPGPIIWGKDDAVVNQNEDEEVEPIEKPNFGLSGALAKDKVTGNVVNGVVLKWSEPPDARIPQSKWRLYVFKGDKQIATLHLYAKSAFLVGRDKTIADVLTEHASCSKQHAVVQFRVYRKASKDPQTSGLDTRPYIMDLGSTNGTFLNGERVESSRFIELREKDLLRFGESTREYVVIRASESS